VTYHPLAAEPVPIWYIEDGHKPDLTDEPIMALHRDLQRVNGRRWIAFRGVPIDCLRSVFFNGVDVAPTDRPIFCGDEQKAFEYARPTSGVDGPGPMYALHSGYLERSFRTLPADASPEEIAQVQITYPYRYEDPYGGPHFSRLTAQYNTVYEAAYGYWIPGNARDALLAIFLRGQVDEVMEAWRDLA
jgi:hypothetical protein